MLVHKGHAAANITSLTYLVAPDHVEDGLRFLLARHDNQPVRTAFDLATLLAKVATHWVKAPPETVKRLKRYARNVCPPASGLGRKNRQRLAPLPDEKNLVRLFLLPKKIRDTLEPRCHLRRLTALLMQLAVALIILTYAPIRIGNLAGLHLTRHLRWSAPGLKGALIAAR
jgi:hypothetical protein